jgi:hypothetical protein
MAELINISQIDPVTFEYQDYSTDDSSLITSFDISSTFNSSTDYLEYFIYDLDGNILFQNVFGYPNYTLLDNNIIIYPEENLKNEGFTEGQYNTVYNFLSPKLASNNISTYYISEISSDRTEIRLDTTNIPNDLVISSSLELINNIQNSTGSYYDFYLDFGNNQLIIANNALLDTSSIDNPTVLIKLYDPLPFQFNINSQCWVVTQLSNPVAYNISIIQTFDDIDNSIRLKGPNTNIDINNQINNSTDYINYQTLTSTTSSLSQGTGSLNYQLNNILAQKGISINVNYSDYNNFINFSSAQTRLENFYYKLQLLEEYTYSSSLSTTSPSSGSYYVSSSNIVWQAKIDEIITTFDPYEYYLYYTSSSSSWPKTGNTPPYTNYSTTSTSGSDWFISQSLVAEEYDVQNNNALINTIPSYLREDAQNAQFELFIEMIGQYFDTVFLYTQDVTNKYNADNRLNYGISKDLVADVLRDLGIKIYQNNFSSNDVYQALIGITPSGSLYNLPYTTTQYPVPTGSFLDYITTYVTASSTSSLIPTDDINKEQYKRIYHNLPLLLKKKGSVAGLRDLITTFGIPDTILRINEFGGKDRDVNSFDNWQDEYNYAFYTSGSSYITSSFVLNSSWNASNNRPQAIEFRFKTNGLPQNTASVASQSLWSTDNGVNLKLRYTGSGYTSGSYSGSIKDPYYQYAVLDFIPSTSSITTSASIYLPFYDGGWWSVLINSGSTGFTLYAANKNYEGEDGNVVGFQASSSVTGSNVWTASLVSTFGSASYKTFTGSFQEIRYYTQPISKSNFDAYVMNPYSTEQSEYLAFRATLGGELYTASVSVHPKVTGSWVTTSSFASNSVFFTGSGGEYISNTEVFYFDQVPAGIQNAVSDKIKQQNIVLPYSSSNTNIPNADVLSPFISIQQFPSISSSYTRDIDYVEVGFSPQNEINEDINSQIGYFNLGDMIGDPRFQSSSLDTYPTLDDLSFEYFSKYESNYDWNDYIRLIKFFDNSLFKLLQDFTPARTSLASGIIIKNTLLDRNRYRTPQVSPSSSIAFVGSGSTNIPYVVEDQTITGSITVGTITGSSGDSLPDDYYLALNPTSSNILFGNSITYQLSQSGVYNVVFNVSSSGGSAATLKVYNSSFVPSTFLGRITESVFTVSSGSDLNTTVNFNANFSTQYITIFNDNDTGSAQTASLSSIKIYHLPAYQTSTPSLTGSVTEILTNYYDFNGELDGTNLIVEDGNFNDYTIDINQVYTTGTFYANTPNSASQSMTFTNNVYDFNFDNVYYISFTAKRWGSPTTPTTLQLLNIDGTVAYTASIPGNNLGGNTGSVTVNQAEIQGILPQTYFYMFTGVGTNGFSASIENFTIFKSQISNPEYLVVEGDVQLSRLNSKYMDVDFTTNAIVAVNEQDILSGSATRAAVPDSYYTTTRIINPRYTGCKLISPTGSRYEGFVNQPMTTGSSIGAIANVEQYCDWFAYFDGVQQTEYLSDSGSGISVIPCYSVHITTLIDINGNKIGLDSNHNITPTSGTGSIVINPISGSYLQNPLISNIPILSTIFPYSSSLSLKQYTNVTGSVVSGSFNPFPIIASGFVPSYYSTPYYWVPNETSIILKKSNNNILLNSTTPGLLIPQNFNPQYKNNLLQIAQLAGFFKNI